MNSTTTSPLAFVGEILSTKRVGILCGAGISIGSGIPTVAGFLAQLCKLLPEDFGVEATKLGSVQFEHLMEQLDLQVGIEGLVQVFQNKQPSLHHEALANLAVRHRIAAILTTNFDTLIEQALDSSGVEFTCIEDLSDIEQLSAAIKGRGLPVIKLHGSAHDLPGLQITLRRVSNHSQQILVKRVFDALINELNLDFVIVLGYSMSDRFDIVPALEACSFNKCKVIYWRHSNLDPSSDAVDTSVLQTVLDSEAVCSAYFAGNTDVLAQSFMGMSGQNGALHIGDNLSWMTSLEQWWAQLGEQKQWVAIATLNALVGELGTSLNASREAFGIAKKNNQIQSAAACACTIARREAEQGKKQEAIIYLEWVIERAKILPKHIEIFARITYAELVFEWSSPEESFKQCFLAHVRLRGTPLFGLAPVTAVDPMDSEAELWVDIMQALAVCLYAYGSLTEAEGIFGQAEQIAVQGGLRPRATWLCATHADTLARLAIKRRSLEFAQKARIWIGKAIEYAGNLWPESSPQMQQLIAKNGIIHALPLAIMLGINPLEHETDPVLPPA